MTSTANEVAASLARHKSYKRPTVCLSAALHDAKPWCMAGARLLLEPVRCTTCSPPLEFLAVPKAGKGYNVILLIELSSLLNSTTSTRRSPAPPRTASLPLCYSVIRDPYERFLSAYAELSERSPTHSFWGGQTNIDARLMLLVSRLRQRGFFQDHFHPQALSLLARDPNRTCLDGMVYVGHTERMHEVTHALLSRLGVRQEQLPAAVLRPQHSRAALNASELRRTFADTSGIRPETRAAVMLAVCQLYVLDFETFGFALPPACTPAVVEQGRCGAGTQQLRSTRLPWRPITELVHGAGRHIHHQAL